MSIYDSIGGAPAVRAAVDDFYARVLANARLAPFFTGTDLERLKAHQRAFLAAAVGGPQIFAGRDMASAHAGSSTPAARSRGWMAECMTVSFGHGSGAAVGR